MAGSPNRGAYFYETTGNLLGSSWLHPSAKLPSETFLAMCSLKVCVVLLPDCLPNKSGIVGIVCYDYDERSRLERRQRPRIAVDRSHRLALRSGDTREPRAFLAGGL